MEDQNNDTKDLLISLQVETQYFYVNVRMQKQVPIAVS